MSAFSESAPRAIRASFRIAHQIAKCKKPFTIGETLIKPCLLVATEEMIDAAAKKKMDPIPLSARKVSRRVDSLALNIEQQLCAEMKISGDFALQFDESTDVSNEAILMGFVRYIKGEEIVEDMFCFYSLPSAHTHHWRGDLSSGR